MDNEETTNPTAPEATPEETTAPEATEGEAAA